MASQYKTGFTLLSKIFSKACFDLIFESAIQIIVAINGQLSIKLLPCMNY